MTRSEQSQTNAPAALPPLVEEVSHLGPEEAAARIEDVPDAQVADLFRTLGPALTSELLQVLDEDKRRAILAAAPVEEGRQWERNLTYPDNSVGRLMELPQPVFPPRLTVKESTARIRELVKTTFVTYAFVVDDGGKLVGVVTMRDLLLADEASPLETIMLRNPFALRPELPLVDAARQVVARHFPVYPVCEGDGQLVGTVRGRTLFEVQALEISAQAGAMVGVEKEERLATPWPRSLRFRHPWLQLNLFTAFLAAAVVGSSRARSNRLSCSRSSCRCWPANRATPAARRSPSRCAASRSASCARAPRAPRRERGAARLLNGALVGLTAGIGMFIVARAQGEAQALTLALVVFAAMCASCVVSGLAGALIPLTLRSLGADPATASSIFLTTATDVASMGLFLSLATLLVR
jgi:magnesium transporter